MNNEETKNTMTETAFGAYSETEHKTIENLVAMAWARCKAGEAAYHVRQDLVNGYMLGFGSANDALIERACKEGYASFERDQAAQSAPVEPPKPKQWQSTAGPIQVKKVKKVFSSLRMEHGHMIELSGVIGVNESSQGYHMIFGGSREDVSKAQVELGEAFGWMITRENYTQIIARGQAMLAELAKNAPVTDKRITAEQDAKDRAEREAWQRERVELMNWLKTTSTQFQTIINRLSSATNKMPEFIVKLWREYSANCESYDQSALLGEFIQNYAAKLGGDTVYNRQKLQTAIDYVEPPKAVQGRTDSIGTKASVKLNDALGGVELWFTDKPGASVIAKLKSNGWRCTSKGGWHWYKKQSEASIRFANELAGVTTPDPAPAGGMDEAEQMAGEDRAAEAMDNFSYVGSRHHY